MKFPLLLVLIGWFICRSVLADTVTAAPLPVAKPEDAGMSVERLRRMHAFIDNLVERRRIAGAVTVVARRGKLVHFEAQGMADIESSRAMRTDDIFAIASMTKPITAAAILMLVEEGRLRLGDPLARYLPEFRDLKVSVPDAAAPDSRVLVPAQRAITIHDLLTHRSGFPGPPGGRRPSPAASMPLPENPTLAQVVAAVAVTPLDVQPGTAWEYGASFDVLGRVVEVVSGQTFDEFLRVRMFEPLGMVDTGFAVPAEKRSRLARNYRGGAEGEGLQALRASFGEGRYPSGSGGLFSTAPDYLRFCQMLLNGGELDGHRLLGRKTIELMTTTHVSVVPLPFLPGQGYGLGVAVQQPGGETGMLGSPGTYGWSGAFNTYFRIDPREQAIVLLMVQLSPPNDIEVFTGFQNVAMQAIVE